MVIRVMYTNRKYDMIKDFVLNDLITSGKVIKFYRSDGWVNVGHDPIRGWGGKYDGPERRKMKT